MKTKKVVIISDLHVGSRSGLTIEPKNNLQVELLKKYKENINLWKNPDIIIANGDLIDGKNKNDPSQTEPDLLRQAEIAFELLKLWNAKRYFLTYGTTFHTGDKNTGTDYEDSIHNSLNIWKPNCAYIADNYENLKINNVIFNIRHFVSSSSVPHTRGTSLLKQLLWNFYKTIVGHGIKANIIIRSHVHYFLSMNMSGVEIITTPVWQAPDSKFGNRICEGDIDNGSIRYIIENSENGDKKWTREIYLLKLSEAKPQEFIE